MKKSLIFTLALAIGTSATLLAAPFGTPPQLTHSSSSEKFVDGQSIVLGKYESRQKADNRLSSLLDFMDSSSKIVNLEIAYGFDYAVKEEGGLYVVSIEPFTETKVINEVLDVVKKQFPEAHAEVCKSCIRASMAQAVEQDQEALDNALALKESRTHIAVEVEEDIPEAKESKNSDLIAGIKKEYIIYGVGGLAVLILIFLFMRKPKKNSDREMREMYRQAKELEEELKQNGEEENDVIDVEEMVSEEEVVHASPKHTPKPEPKVAEPVAAKRAEPVATPEPVITPEPVAPKTAEPVKAAPQTAKEEPTSAPTAASATKSHKLREPNKAVTTITKENFKEFEGLRLLIAEDNLINQKVIVGLLKGSGINIKIANDGQECLDILAEDPNYPIILMDAHMPRIDGLEATKLIRANPAYDHITVMALSGDTGADDIRKMRECGMEEQLEKPLKIAALYQAIYCYFDPDALGEGEDLPEIHLDNSLGLEMLGGDVELYNEILAEFESLYKDSDEKIELWIKHEDYDRAKALLLDVKGIGESIGTAELTATAEEFREALIAGESNKYDKLMNRYRTQLKSILADIAEV